MEAHGEEFKLAPAFKIKALRMLMMVQAKEYFGICEADRDTTDAAKSYEGLLGKVKDNSRRMQHGGDPMDVGADGG